VEAELFNADGRTDRRDEAKNDFVGGFNNLFAHGYLVD
jgi:hypothetical protein